jgi:hypothetical protein
MLKMLMVGIRIREDPLGYFIVKMVGRLKVLHGGQLGPKVLDMSARPKLRTTGSRKLSGSKWPLLEQNRRASFSSDRFSIKVFLASKMLGLDVEGAVMAVEGAERVWGAELIKYEDGRQLLQTKLCSLDRIVVE